MPRVMLVDDEGLVRLALRAFLENSSYQVCAEASSGQQALALYAESAPVDILLTDISMPGGDGLFLLEELGKRQDAPLMVVLSAYNDYTYVRQAFKLGAQDYILKSDMTREKVLSFLDDMLRLTRLKDESSSVPSVEKGVYLKAMLDGIMPVEPTRMREYGFALESTMVAAFVWIDDFSAVREKYTEDELGDFRVNVLSTISAVLQDIPGCEAAALNPQEYLILVSTASSSRKALQDKVNQVMMQIHYCLRTYLNVTASIGLSDAGTADDLTSLCRAAEFGARMRFIFGKNKTIYPEQVRLVSNERSFTVSELSDGFTAALDTGDEVLVLKELDALFKKISRHLGADFKKSNVAYHQLVFLLMKYLNEHGASAEIVLGHDVDFYSRLQQFETQAEIQHWIHNVSRAIVSYFKDRNSTHTHNFILSAKEFISRNYAEEISLKVLSEYVGFSESYLSAQFAKETGESFTDYLIRVRMNKAKELLDTTALCTYEIGQAVGYANAEHFSRMFKKQTGLSPGRYRNRNNKQ